MFREFDGSAVSLGRRQKDGAAGETPVGGKTQSRSEAEDVMEDRRAWVEGGGCSHRQLNKTSQTKDRLEGHFQMFCPSVGQRVEQMRILLV